ncbi:Signal recognition particle protein [Aphelenchoides avenae]|nr:Signal recognition particle protein [Aphelenchus avenae]
MDPKEKPLSDEARWICVYPLYINAKKTTAQGRRVPTSVGIENPTAQEIHDVLSHTGFSCKLEKNKMHPLDPSRDGNVQGRVRVQLKNDDGTPVKSEFRTRRSLLLHACELIPKLKSRQTGGGSAPAASQPSGGGKKKKK